ncbi:MAG: DMT family transporter [Acidimicrobiales bacterium]
MLLAGQGGGVGFGAVFVVGACVCWGLDNNLTATATGVTPAQSTLAKGVVAGTANLLIGLNTEHSTLSAGSVGWALGVGAAGYGMSIILWVTSARRLGAARSQGVFATAPFVGMALGWILTDDPVQTAQLVALVVMVIGVALVVTSSHLHEHRHPAETHTHRHRHDDDHHTHTHTEPVSGWHIHEHEHLELVHAHDHVPDEAHRHPHAG